jgi:hypothetical protein
VDRGDDRKKLLEPLLDRHGRLVIDGKNVRRGVAEWGARCRLRHHTRVVKIEDGKKMPCDLCYGVERTCLVGRPEQL